MLGTVRAIDRLLRGNFTRPDDLREGRILVPAGTLAGAGLLLGAVYGVFMGLYSVLRPIPSGVQLVATTIKVPALFLLTLVVTFPSLYVFSALSRSRLRAPETLRLLLAAIGVNLAILASFGPVTGFFTLSTESYPFMVVLNVVFFGIAGIVGVAFLARALASVFREDVPPLPPPPPPPPPAEGDGPSPPAVPVVLFVHPPRGRIVLRTWIVIYAVVGAQMGWILRPFVGAPDLPFTAFRDRESNFFLAFFRAVGALFS
ncbi:MAG: hypothetical protein HY812_15230 [Planctomycetes bacterium]|nr:hypothetical protein [Planctomycetota bacterium]